MECPLCIIWARMPYAKRWSTPTTAHDTEGALVIGYWIATRYENAQLCQKHLSLILRLNQTQAGNILQDLAQHIRQPLPSTGPSRVNNHTFVTLPDPPPPGAIYICSHTGENGNCGKNARYEASANFDVNGHTGTVKRLLCPEHAIALASKESKPEPEEFKFGPGPLTNENTVTVAPPLPVVIPFPGVDLISKQPGTNQPQVQSAIDFALQPKHDLRSAMASAREQGSLMPGTGCLLPQNPTVDPTELAKQAALMPATEGRRIESFTPAASDEPDKDSME